MSQTTHVNPISSGQEPSTVLMERVLHAVNEPERQKRSRKAKAAWQRRRERLFRASHDEAFIYVRSTNADDFQLQESLLKDKAAKLDLQCTQVFYDSCTGITDPFARPGFSQLMKAVRAIPTVSIVLAVDLTRIGRSRTYLSHVKSHLKDHGVELMLGK
ncbi:MULTISPECIES: recombinase family protein [Alicyclobacillus]|nr:MULTISPECIES: recombinase family protein [Alicyclobacillus]MDP9729708.1 DNA invertase Pin-like site-specific DNA recombinase [Alicyclobacillus tengchongensis]